MFSAFRALKTLNKERIFALFMAVHCKKNCIFAELKKI